MWLKDAYKTSMIFFIIELEVWKHRETHLAVLEAYTHQEAGKPMTSTAQTCSAAKEEQKDSSKNHGEH